MPSIDDLIGGGLPLGSATTGLGITRGQAGQPASYLDRYMQQRAQRLDEIEQMGPIQRFFGPNAERRVIEKELLTGEDMQRKQQATAVQSIAELRKQEAAQRDSVRNFTKGYWDILKDLKGESEDNQKALRPFVAKRMKRDNKAFAMGLDDEDIDNFVNVEGFAEQAIAAIDPFLTEQETEVNRKRLAQAKPADRETIYKDINARVTERVQAVVREKMPQLIREAGASGQPVTPDLLKRVIDSPQFAERLGVYGKSLVLKREVHAFLDDPKNAEVLAQYGVTGIGKSVLAGQTTKATELAQVDPAVTAGKATQAEAVTAATERAKLAPDIVAGQAAAEKQKQLARLAPEILSAEVEKERRKTEAVEGIKAKYAQPQQAANLANVIRDDFTNVTKDFRTIKDSWARIDVSTKTPSPAGDLSLVFNYMKMLDPGSVVRESEFATAQNLGPVGQRLQSWYNKNLTADGRLADEARKDLAQNAKALFQTQLAGHADIETQFRDIATRQGVNVKDAVPDFVGKYRGTAEKTADKPKDAVTRTGAPTRTR